MAFYPTNIGSSGGTSQLADTPMTEADAFVLDKTYNHAGSPNNKFYVCKIDESITTIHVYRQGGNSGMAIGGEWLFADGEAYLTGNLITIGSTGAWSTATISVPSGAVGIGFWFGGSLGTGTLKVYFT